MIRNSPIYLTALAHGHYAEYTRALPSATARSNASATYILFYFSEVELESLYNESDAKRDREQELALKSETVINAGERKRLKHNPFRNLNISVQIILLVIERCSVRKYSRRRLKEP